MTSTGEVSGSVTAAGGSQPSCTTASAISVLQTGASMKGISSRGLRISGRPNSRISFTFSSEAGTLATASMRSDSVRENNRMETASDSVAPAPPIKVNAPIRLLFSAYTPS